MVLNTFSGFPYEWYTPNNTVRVKDTFIYKFLRDVYGEGKEGPLLDYVLNMFAHYVQKPDVRSERICAILSPGEGTGKSTVFHIFTMILSTQYTKFHGSLQPYLDKFNITNMGKLLHWCDDISASGQKETRMLFAKVTCKKEKYEQKGETCIQISEFSNLFITANEECPLHTHPGDRRQLILEASDAHKQDREFFGKVYDEIEDLDVGYAFYTFCKERDISKWNPSHNPPTLAKEKTIACCMKKSHIFLNEFFVNKDWVRKYIPQGTPWPNYFRKINAHVMERGGERTQKGRTEDTDREAGVISLV
jgi:hypothetical protein